MRTPSQFWQRVIWGTLAVGSGALSAVVVKGDPALGAAMAAAAAAFATRAFKPFRRVIKKRKPEEGQV